MAGAVTSIIYFYTLLSYTEEMQFYNLKNYIFGKQFIKIRLLFQEISAMNSLKMYSIFI